MIVWDLCVLAGEDSDAQVRALRALPESKRCDACGSTDLADDEDGFIDLCRRCVLRLTRGGDA